MAPPPPANQPLGQRLTTLAQTLQFGWFVGHAVLLLCVARYGLSYVTLNYYSRWAQFAYRTAFIAAGATYGIVVFKGYRTRARQGKQQSLIDWIEDENVQYLLMAVIWLFSRQVLLALLPYFVYSVFHVATYTRSSLIPTITGSAAQQPAATQGKPAQQSNAFADAIGKFVKQNYDTSMTLVAGLEIALWFRLLFSSILLQKGAMTLLVFYTVFFRLRFAKSEFVKNIVRELTARADAMGQNQSTPPVVRQIWDQVKFYTWKFVELTDIRRYVGGAHQQPGSGPKKAQ